MGDYIRHASLRQEDERGKVYIDPMEAAQRLAAGEQTAADVEWVGRAFAALLSNMGEVSLERCLHLPTSYSAWLKSSRDEWLCQAASLLRLDGSWKSAQQLAADWTKFIQRGNWQRWNNLDSPPDQASPIETAFFYASKLNKSKSLDAKQVSRILRHSFTEKCL